MSDTAVLVSRETEERLHAYARLLLTANARQNLIGRSTEAALWHRHIEDSLQLLPHAPRAGRWVDIGSGAGLPGLVVAIARPDSEVILVEPRPLRAAFLDHVIDQLSLGHAKVIARRVEALPPLDAAIISARAVAPLSDLLAIGAPHAAPGCVWLLPKGRRAADELAVARRTWQGTFDLIPSRTDPEAAIVMARDVRPLARTPRAGR